MSLLLKAIVIILLVSCSTAAPVEKQLQDVDVEILAIDDSATKGLQNILPEGEDALTRTKRQFGLGDLFGGIIRVGYGGGGGYNNYGNYGNRYGNGGYGGNYNGYNNYNNYNNGYGHGGYDGHHHHHDDYHGHGHYDDHYDDHYDHHHHH